MRFAGTYHPIVYLTERLKTYLQGVTQVDALWVDYNNNLYTLNDKAPLNEELKVSAQRIRNSADVSCWSDTMDIFQKDLPSKKQLTLDSEDELRVLKFYFTSPIDGKKDILLFSFPDNLFLRNINTTFKGITTDEKMILEKILYAVLHADYQKAIEERQFLAQYQTIQEKSQNKLKQLTEEIQETQRLYSNAIQSIIYDFKRQLEDELSCEIEFPDETIYKLARERLAIEEIQDIVRNAVFLAYNFNTSSKTLKITEDLIVIQAKNTTTSHKQKDTNAHEGNKVIQLLDRYEEAANRVLTGGNAVNARLLAAKLDPPITPPAITDAIKKNRHKISYLFKQYPERWNIIRKSIRPLTHIDTENDLGKQFAS